MSLLGWFIKTNDRRRNTQEGYASAIRMRSLAGNRDKRQKFEQRTSAEILVVVHQLEQLHNKAVVLASSPFGSMKTLKDIFEEMKVLKREKEQLTQAQNLEAQKSRTQTNFLLRAIREQNVQELRSTQKLLLSSGLSDRELQRKEAKLELMNEVIEEPCNQQELEEEVTEEEVHFKAWLAELRSCPRSQPFLDDSSVERHLTRCPTVPQGDCL